MVRRIVVTGFFTIFGASAMNAQSTEDIFVGGTEWTISLQYTTLNSLSLADLPWWNNSNAILNALEPVATKMLGSILMGGTEKARLDAINQVLNRTMGKPIERQLSLHSDISKLSEEEVDREISKLVTKLSPDIAEKIFIENGFDGKTDITEFAEGQEQNMGREEALPLQTK